jgi:hypothetical protein
MRRIIGVLGVAIGLGGSALAADLPPSPPRAPAVYVPAVLPVYNWAGVYVGINGGWGWGNAKFTANAVGTFPGTTGSRSDNGGVVGGTLGANFQAGAFVFGVEGDWDYSAINTGTTASICTFSGSCQTGNNWLATARGRAGYAADRVLFPVMPPIASCSSPPLATLSQMCRRTSTAPPPVTLSPAGPPAPVSNGPLLIIGPPKSSISMSISATAA